MKYTEFEGIICHLGKDYRVVENDSSIYVVYKDAEILRVGTKHKFILLPFSRFDYCPKKSEIWEVASLLAATPISDRVECKYNVIVGNDDTRLPYNAWAKDSGITYFLSGTNAEELREDPDFEFTESEYQDLLKYIKTLPQGDKQVEIVKIGKTLVEGK